MAKGCSSGKWFVLALGIVCTVLAIVVLPKWARAAAPDLPPRPATPTPTPQPTVRPTPKARRDAEPPGAFIELRVLSTDREFASHWQHLWTVVQWQDGQGRWPLEYTYNGKTWVDVEEKGKPSKWVTLRALRVIRARVEAANGS